MISGLKARLLDPHNMHVHPEDGQLFVVQLGRLRRGLGHRRQRGGPPRFTVGGPNGMLLDPRGVVIDAMNNAVSCPTGTQRGADLRGAAGLQANVNRERRAVRPIV